MCKCVVNVQMRGQCANVRMCKCANGRFKLLASLRANAQLCKGDNLHILTFSHLHINPAFAHYLIEVSIKSVAPLFEYVAPILFNEVARAVGILVFVLLIAALRTDVLRNSRFSIVPTGQ